MGLIRGIISLGSNLLTAAKGAAGSALQDQWKEYFYCESIPNDTLMVKGETSPLPEATRSSASSRLSASSVSETRSGTKQRGRFLSRDSSPRTLGRANSPAPENCSRNSWFFIDIGLGG